MLKKTLALLISNFLFFSLAASEDFRYYFGASLNFKEGIPFVRVHVKNYQKQLEIEGRTSILCGEKTILADSAKISVKKFSKSKISYFVALEELSRSSLKIYKERASFWAEALSSEVEIFTTGAVFSINSSKIDNREYFVVLKGAKDLQTAGKFLGNLQQKFPEASITLKQVLEKEPESTLVVNTGKKEYLCSNVVTIKNDEKSYKFDGEEFKNTSSFFITADSGNTLNLATEESVETILYRILPGEMFLSAPLETLKSQAVAARTDIFMQLGKRHISEPFHICSEVHCQKIKWEEKTINPKFIQAVDQTRGEIILYSGLYVARAPYSSSCGGHTEDIRNVWFTAEKEYLRGVWDMEEFPELDLTKEENIEQLFKLEGAADNIKINSKFRWSKTISVKDMNNLTKKLKIGEIKAIKPIKRGVSGRIYVLEIEGVSGKTTIYGELNIRKLLDNLNSSLFILSKNESGFVFRGAGWGHGVGLCQMGAIGLGQIGKDYKYILERYYPETVSTKIY